MSNKLLSNSDCRFCAIAKEGKGACASALDTPWLETSSYIAMTSVGAFIPGWSLVVPRAHSLNLSEDYLRKEFYSFTREVVSLVEREFGHVCIFEHGSNAADSATSCGTAHAHLHIVPFSGDLVQLSMAFDPTLKWSKITSREIAPFSQGGEYLFVANEFADSETIGQLTMLSHGRSQFFRQVLAQAVNKAESYNYRQYPYVDESMDSALAMHGQAHPYEEVA